MSETKRWWRNDKDEVFCSSKQPHSSWQEVANANGDPLTAAPQEHRSCCEPTDPLAAPPIGEVFGSMQTKFPQQPPDRTVPGRIGRDHETGNYFEIRQTPSAYSVEEHMFNQDEIQRRHPQQPDYDGLVWDKQPTDQQRSEPLYETHAAREIRLKSDQQRSEVELPLTSCKQKWQATDQQRSDAVTEKKRCCCQCGKEMWCYISEEVQTAIAERDEQLATERELHKMTFKAHQKSIAERDATIAALRAALKRISDTPDERCTVYLLKGIADQAMKEQTP